MGFWLNPLNKVRGSHKLKILSHCILRYKTHQLHHTRDFFNMLRFLKKTVANKLLNSTTGAVGDIQRHQFSDEVMKFILSIYSIFQL